MNHQAMLQCHFHVIYPLLILLDMWLHLYEYITPFHVLYRYVIVLHIHLHLHELIFLSHLLCHSVSILRILSHLFILVALLHDEVLLNFIHLNKLNHFLALLEIFLILKFLLLLPSRRQKAQFFLQLI